MSCRPRWTRPDHSLVAVLAAVVALVAAACGAGSTPTGVSTPSPASATAAPTPTATPSGPTPVVVDSDLGADDMVAIPFLLRQPSIDVLAVTVVGTGLVHCLDGVANVTRLAATLGLAEIATSCGRSEPLAGTHAFPEEWRTASDGAYGLALENRPASVPDLTAPQLIRSVAQSAGRPITIVALGPLTNLAEALRDDPSLAARIERIVAMAGAIDVPGNVSLGPAGSAPLAAEWNVYADPTAADIVFRSGVPITLVPLDATNHVPLDAAFLAALEADHAAAAADVAYELLARRGIWPNEYLWDPLASAIAIDAGVASFETVRLRVETAEGADSGRTVRADDGVAIRVAMTADRAAFEKRLLAGLRVGPPRSHPFLLAGTMRVRFDGTTCADEHPTSVTAGAWKIEITTTVGGSTMVVVVRFHEGAGWQDLLDYARTEKDPTAQPAFLDAPFGAALEAAGTTGILAQLTPGTYGIVCLRPADSPPRGVPGGGSFAVTP